MILALWYFFIRFYSRELMSFNRESIALYNRNYFQLKLHDVL